MHRFVCACCLVGLLVLPAQAQYALRAGHAGSGHAVVEGSGYALQATVGQPASRIVGNDPYLGAGFWYAVRNEKVALPVELAAFDALQQSDGVLLQWRTTSETDNAGFEVERRSGREEEWRTIAFVEGAGTTSEPQAYRFADRTLPYEAETLTYRLKQVDTGGAFDYSETVTLELAVPDQLVLHGNAPNPFRHQTTIRYALPRPSEVRLRVYDLLGRRVATLVDGRQSAGRREITFGARGLSSGVYFVRLQAGDRTITQRLTVMR